MNKTHCPSTTSVQCMVLQHRLQVCKLLMQVIGSPYCAGCLRRSQTPPDECAFARSASHAPPPQSIELLSGVEGSVEQGNGNTALSAWSGECRLCRETAFVIAANLAPNAAQQLRILHMSLPILTFRSPHPPHSHLRFIRRISLVTTAL